MWAEPRRWLYAVRSLEPDLGRRLGSWRLSIVLMVVACLYYAFLAVWAAASPPHVVRNIATLLPFWLLYVMLLVNTGVCLVRRLPVLRREISAEPQLATHSPAWQVETPAGLDRASAEAMIRRLGYRVRRREEGRIGGVRRRWAGLGTFLFHGAFFLVAIGFLTTLLARQETKVWVATGERYDGSPGQFLSRSVPRPLTRGVPALDFRVEEIRPGFWRDQLLFTELEADLTLPSGRRATTRINRPLWLSWGTFLRLSGFGYAPRYELTDRDGAVIDSAFVKLNVFPPGQEDYFRPGGYPHRVYVAVLPDFAVEGGEPVTRSLNLVHPATLVRVWRGRLELGRAVLQPGDSFTFEGLTLGFPEIRYWGEFTAVGDPGAPLLFVGFLLGLAGLLLKLPGQRAEIEWRPAAAGAGRLVGWGGRPPERWPAAGGSTG